MIYIDITQSKSSILKSMLGAGYPIKIKDLELFKEDLVKLAFGRLKKAILSECAQEDLQKVICISCHTLDVLFDKENLNIISADFVNSLMERGTLDNSCEFKTIKYTKKDIVNVIKFKLCEELQPDNFKATGNRPYHWLKWNEYEFSDIKVMYADSAAAKKIRYLAKTISIDEDVENYERDQLKLRITKYSLVSLVSNNLDQFSNQLIRGQEYISDKTTLINSFLNSESGHEELLKFENFLFSMIKKDRNKYSDLLPTKSYFNRFYYTREFTVSIRLEVVDGFKVFSILIPEYGTINHSIKNR